MNSNELTREIKTNNKYYKTTETIYELLKDILPEAIKNNDFSAAHTIIILGELTGQVIEIS